MSKYKLTPNDYRAMSGPQWVPVGGAISGGMLADGSDSTWINCAGPVPLGSEFVLRLSSVSVPANEVAVSLRPTVRGCRALGTTGYCRLYVGWQPDPTRFTGLGAPALNLPLSAAFATVSGGASPAARLSQAQVDAAALILQVGSGMPAGTTLKVSEASVELTTTSVPQTPVVSAPSGTITDTTRPLVEWTHVDRTEATVTNKASSGTTRTITTGAAHGFVVGQFVGLDIGDVDYVPVTGILSVTSTTFTFTAAAGKTQSTTSASGTAWVGDDKAQSSARVLVVNSAQYSATGFSPDKALASGDYVWTTLVNGADSSFRQFDSDLGNDGYRAYLQTESTYGAVKVKSPWSYSAFTIALTPAAAPLLTLGWDDPSASVTINVRGQCNMLTANQSGFELGGLGTVWGVGANCALSVQAAAAKSGTQGMRLRSSASGNMSARSILPVGVGQRPAVRAGETYCASAQVKAVSTARSCRLDIEWYDASGTLLSTTTGTAVNDATGSHVRISCVGTAPTDAVTARLLVTVLAAGAASEDHYVDEVGLWPGDTLPTWSAGTILDGEVATGGLASYELLVERTTDNPYGDNPTWIPVRRLAPDVAGSAGWVLDAATQTWVGMDYEAPRGGPLGYRASVLTVVDDRATVLAATDVTIRASAPAIGSVVSTIDGRGWLKDIEDPTANCGFGRLTTDGYGESRDTLAETMRPSGGGAFVVQHPGGLWDRKVRIVTTSVAEADALRALAGVPRRLLLQMADTDSTDFARQAYGVLTGSSDLEPMVPPAMWEFTGTLTVTA